MEEERRMAGDYEIFQAISVGSEEIVLGENIHAAPGERYMCARCTSNGIVAVYREVMVSDDYTELLQLYGQRIAETAQQLLEVPLPDHTPVAETAVTLLNSNDDLHNKVVVIRADVLKKEFQKAAYQYQLVIGGFGASANSRGSACYCTSLFNGETARFERRDILGVVHEDQMPAWVRHGFEQIKKQREKERER